MRKTYSELKIGITVLVAFAIIIGVILWGKGYSLTAKSRQLTVRFEDISGLEQGAFVLVNGVRKGRVLEFVLEQEGVLVRVSLNENVLLYDDARFEIASPELMGAKVIDIFPGISGRVPAADYVFRGESGGGMNQLMKLSAELVTDVKGLLGVLEITVSNINKTAGDPRMQEAFLSSIRNLDESSQRTLELIRLNEGRLNEVMNNLVVTTGSIRNVVEANTGDINHTVTDLHDFVAQLKEISQRLNQVVQMLQGEEGTLGILINDKEMAVKLDHTLTELDSLVQQVRAEGIKTNINLFGRKK